MKPLMLIATCALAIGAAGCERTRSNSALQLGQLDCPESQGELTRVAMAADGRSCTYRAGPGTEVELRLVPVRGDPEAVLADIERELRGLRGETLAGDVQPAVAAAPSPATLSEAEAVEAQALADAGEGEPESEWAAETVDTGSGERTSVRLPGVRIDAEDERANIKIGPVQIDADHGGATVKAIRDVRLKGESLSREQRGLRATFILAGEDAAGPYSYVGYEAGGPKAGPLTVALVKSQSGHHDRLQSDVAKLVRRNGGV